MKTPLVSAALLSMALSVGSAQEQKAPPIKPGAALPAAPEATVVKDVTPDQAEKLLKERKDVVVLDVRTADEFKEGHIDGAKNVDAMGDSFRDQLAGLDRDKTYVLHCASGGRSTRVLKDMKALDFKSVYHMNGGMRGWQEAGKPVKK
jgi:phage shock protein E